MTTSTDPFTILYTDPSEEDDMNETAEDRWCNPEPMDSFEFSDKLAALLLGDQTYDDAFPSLTRAEFFSAAGVMTTNDGLVVTLSDGSEYQVTVVRSR